MNIYVLYSNDLRRKFTKDIFMQWETFGSISLCRVSIDLP